MGGHTGSELGELYSIDRPIAGTGHCRWELVVAIFVQNSDEVVCRQLLGAERSAECVPFALCARWLADRVIGRRTLQDVDGRVVWTRRGEKTGQRRD